MRFRCTTGCLAVLVGCFVPHPVRAQGTDSGITVYGIGEVAASPNVAEIDVYTATDVRSVGTEIQIDLSTRASAELTADAIVKYRDAKRRTLDALAGLKMDQLLVEDRGTWITSMGSEEHFGGQGGNQTAAAAQIVLAGAVRLKLLNTGQLSEQELMELVAKVLDAAKDSGASIGGNPLQGMGGRYYGDGSSGFALPAGVAEDSKKAAARLGDNHERLGRAFAAATLKDVELQDQGLSMVAGMSAAQAQQQMYGYQQSGMFNSDAGLIVSRKTVVRLRNLRGRKPEELAQVLMRLVDLAKESGASVATPPQVTQPGQMHMQTAGTALVRFLVQDLPEIREEAYAKAVADARQRAARLAKLTGVTLGRPVFVQEMEVAGDQPTPQAAWNQYQGYNPGVVAGSGVTSDALAPVPVRVKLWMRFAIASEERATAGGKN